jgi:hypothetical protein
VSCQLYVTNLDTHRDLDSIHITGIDDVLCSITCFFRVLKLITRKFLVAMSGTGKTSPSNFDIYL